MVTLNWVMKAWWLAALWSLRCNVMSRSVVDVSPELLSGVVSDEDGEQLQRVNEEGEEFLDNAKDSRRIIGTSTTNKVVLTPTVVVQEYDRRKVIEFRHPVEEHITVATPPEYYGSKILSINFAKYHVGDGIVEGLPTMVDDLEDLVGDSANHIDGLLICNERNSTELSRNAGGSIELFECVLKGEGHLQALKELLDNAKDRMGGTTIGGVVVDPEATQKRDGRKMLPNVDVNPDVTKFVGDYIGKHVGEVIDNLEDGEFPVDSRDALTEALKGTIVDVITGNQNGTGGTGESILGAMFSLECLNDTSSKLPEDEAYVVEDISDSWLKFYQTISDLPNIRDLPDDSPELATYVAIICSISLFAFLCIIIIMYIIYTELVRKKKEEKMEIKQDSTPLRPPPLWPKVLLFFFSLATAAVVGVGLNFIHKQATEATVQLRGLSDYTTIIVQQIQDVFTAARTAAWHVITTNIEGFVGCLSPETAGLVTNETTGYINSTLDNLQSQVPNVQLLQLADDFDAAANAIENTVNVRIAIVLTFTVISIAAIFCAGLEYALARSKLNSFKKFFSCCKVSSGCVAFCRKTFVAFVCALAIVGSCISFGGSAGLLHLIATNCLDPQQKLSDLIPPNSDVARQVLEFYLTCVEREGHIDIESILYQTRCVTSHMGGSSLPRFCLVDSAPMRQSLRELDSLSYNLTNKLSCSEVNALYVDLVHDNICTDATKWAIVVLVSSLAYTFFIFLFCWKCYVDRERIKEIILAESKSKSSEEVEKSEVEVGKGEVDYYSPTHPPYA